jgi:thiamine-monophosphate kinase
MSGEFDYIRQLRERIPPAPGIIVGPGDDCAVLARPLRSILATTDLLQDGVDFRLSECGALAAGRKAMAVNFSDIAAMAGVPTAALIGLCLPKQDGMAIAEAVFDGAKSVADRFSVPIAGGDTNSWDGPLVISITVMGESSIRGPVRRSGAKPGDWLFVTGPLGGSIRSRHMDPQPRIREAFRLHEVADLHAMIDISDGLAADLGHLCRESNCGALLEADAIPIHEDARKSETQSALDGALHDGEDFELLFAVSPADGTRLIHYQPVPGLTLVKIGECTESGLEIRRNGKKQAFIAKGWVHTMG